MSPLAAFFANLPLWALILEAVILASIAFTLVYGLISRHRLRTHLIRVANNTWKPEQLLDRYPLKRLMRSAALVEKTAAKYDSTLPERLGLGEIWIDRLLTRKKSGDLKRVLSFLPESGLFSCFLATLENPKLEAPFLDWIDSRTDFLGLRRIAMSGRGELFDSEKALALFENRLDEIREMTGDPEWPSRYFAYKILLADQDPKSVRSVWEGFDDSRSLIRKTLAREFSHSDEDRLFETLKTLLLNDPAAEVRNEARDRIREDFTSRYDLDFEQLNDLQKLHLMENLDCGHTPDNNLAMEILESENLELRFMAAMHLQSCGSLDRLFLECSLEDREQMSRNKRLLEHAADVNVTSFLEKISKTENPGPLMVAAQLLQTRGAHTLITPLTKKVFSFCSHDPLSPDLKGLYRETLKAVHDRGNDQALSLLREEMSSFKESEERLNLLLPNIPENRQAEFVPLLMDFLKSPGFPAGKALRKVFLRVPQSLVLPELIKILRSGRDSYPHEVRIATLKLLGEMRQSYCLQPILENLYIFPLDDAREFARILADYPEDLFRDRVNTLLKGSDATIRAAIIAALPATGKKEFMSEIKKALSDADPEVRISAIWSLVDFNETKALQTSIEMLRDPVERVRIESALALGTHGTDASLDHLEALLKDPNEVTPVKKAAIRGLGAGKTVRTLDILVDRLSDEEESLEDDLISALAEKTSKKDLTQLINHFKDGRTDLKEKIAQAFARMNEIGEAAALDLMKEDIPSLKTHLNEILEKTGYVESQIRKLSHRDPKIRREAAEVLSIFGTPFAFRGIVLAARDPNQEVRVCVTKALERLDSEEGKTILQELESDPDKRVRKYTQWALERIRSRSL